MSAKISSVSQKIFLVGDQLAFRTIVPLDLTDSGKLRENANWPRITSAVICRRPRETFLYHALSASRSMLRWRPYDYSSLFPPFFLVVHFFLSCPNRFTFSSIHTALIFGSCSCKNNLLHLLYWRMNYFRSMLYEWWDFFTLATHATL